MNDMITPGSRAPDFKLKSHLGPEVSLSQYHGRANVMLVFYPLDWTPT